jgi:hypothetical protein
VKFDSIFLREEDEKREGWEREREREREKWGMG